MERMVFDAHGTLRNVHSAVARPAEGRLRPPLAGLLHRLISGKEAGVFKPAPRVYALPAGRFGLPPAEAGFVSANPGDGQAARRAGLRVVRVNPSAAPDGYGLVAADVPSLADLSCLPDLLR